MVSDITIDKALALNWPIVDVRSPGEFKKGHITSASNIALFSNDERAHIGTVYKQESQEAAIALGYKYANPKLQDYISQSSKLAPEGKIIIHCWRGGMRSRSFAQHLADNGFTDVRVITKGYKAFRNHVLNSLSSPTKLKVLGGYTGSGKTYILEELKKLGQQVIDLEGLANHKGSAFGGIGLPYQPSTEQFENMLFTEWSQLNPSETIWVEDESQSIGKIQIPIGFFEQMRKAA
ncbi:MAG: tRNA 2-selenouridine(34) synthase MnmH, partial [Bacteroidales bacterium]|nr:tRNA 2-selenouridine(34) synthase MnmH [Bacteroidales bacterium]